MKNTVKYILSFVVPFYNRPECAIRCIDSILNQLDLDCELIIVDDGSSTKNKQIIAQHLDTQWQHLSSNIQLISQQNQGCSVARNTGINASNGEYITFIDSDDTLENDFVRYAKKLTKQKSNNCDLFIFEINYVDFNTGEIRYGNVLSDYYFKTPGQFADAIIKNYAYLWYSQSNKLYKRNIIVKNNVMFKKDVSFGEDRLFNYDYLTYISGGVITDTSVMLNYYSYDYPTQSSKSVPNYWDIVMMLHEKKLECLFRVCNNSNNEDIMQFKLRDLTNEIERAIKRFDKHPNEEKEYIDKINSMIFLNESDCPHKLDFIIVLGSSGCKYRINKAYEFSLDHDVGYFVVCGKPKCLYCEKSEAQFMQDFLLDHNIAKDKIIIDNKSINSTENIRQAFDKINRTIKEKHIGTYSNNNNRKKVNIGVVSGGFHLKRVKNIIEQQKNLLLKTNHTLACCNLNFYYIPAYVRNLSPEHWYKNEKYIRIVLDNFVL